jgi:uncharacterized membrane protein (UPF0182 family)
MIWINFPARGERFPRQRDQVQAEMYGTYHTPDPTTFYNREDRWEVPHELYRDREIEVAPYYVITQLPNAEKPEFLLMLPLSVAGKNQMAGWLAGLSDGENYGKMVAFRFPKGTFIDGPAQVESVTAGDWHCARPCASAWRRERPHSWDWEPSSVGAAMSSVCTSQCS